MENDKFQELIITHFKELSTTLKDVKSELKEIKSKLKEHDERFDKLDDDIEKVATQVEKLVINENEFTTWAANRRESDLRQKSHTLILI